jgi:hypothetical protein
MTDEQFKELLAEEKRVGALIDANPTDKGLHCLAHHISLQIDAEYQDMAEAQRLGMRVTDAAFKAYKATFATRGSDFTDEELSQTYISHINPKTSWIPNVPPDSYVVYVPRFSDDPSKMFDENGRYVTQDAIPISDLLTLPDAKKVVDAIRERLHARVNVWEGVDDSKLSPEQLKEVNELVAHDRYLMKLLSRLGTGYQIEELAA